MTQTAIRGQKSEDGGISAQTKQHIYTRMDISSTMGHFGLNYL